MEQKRILITGVSSGIGKSVAEALVSTGAIVYGTSRKSITPPQGVRLLQLDVTQQESINHAITQMVEAVGGIDVLINNAGMGIGGAAELATKEEIDLQMNTNFVGCALMCSAVLPIMRKQRSGLIINLSSIGGVMGIPFQGLYAASKFAVEGYSEALSMEVKPFGVEVVLVEPGDFATGFTGNRLVSAKTQHDNDYAPYFERALAAIEKDENNGLKPEVLAKKIVSIIHSKHRNFRYIVASGEQKFSVLIKLLLPSRLFQKILSDYYKL